MQRDFRTREISFCAQKSLMSVYIARLGIHRHASIFRSRLPLALHGPVIMQMHRFTTIPPGPSQPSAVNEQKLSIWGKVKAEAVHYWQGTKLLGAEVAISSRLLVRILKGSSLSRRELRQVLYQILG